MRSLHLIGLSIVISMILAASFAVAEEHPVWNPGLEQAATGALGAGKPPASIDALRASLNAYLTMTDAQLRAQIGSMRGGAPPEGGARYARAQATYNLALLAHLTDDADAARRARVLLERYAEQFPGWSYEVCTASCGVWTDWYHNDFDVSMLLALAFDLLAPRGALGESEASIRELLVQIVQRDLEYRLYTFNWAFYRPLGFVIFGRVLDDPELVHLGYWFYAKHMHEYYTHDGFPTEGSYSYHIQQTTRFVEARQAYYFDGYSDPVGYTHIPLDTRWDPPRIDNYDTHAMWGDHHERMMRSLRETTLPNGQFPILNDTAQYDQPHGAPPDKSVLLGGLGHALLAGGTGVDQTQARLDFSHTVGHYHRDALHLIYYGDQTETVGGTAYRYPDIAWNTSTLSQNLVVIDEAEQRSSYFVDWTMSPYVPGRAERTPVRRSLWNQTTANLHNDVLMWEPGFGDFLTVQVVEADALNAYQDHADLYRRMLALVHIEGDNYYLADFFRVRGGAQYDWTLHGGHAENTLELDLATTGASGSLGQISFQAQATPDGPWSARFIHGDVTGRVMMTGAPGTTVYKATGPRYHYGGSQDHMVVRRAAERTDNVSFVAVHETYPDNPRVVAIEQLSFQGESDALGVKVTLADGRVDYLLQSTDEGPDYVRHQVDSEDLSFAGRFAHIRVDAQGGAMSMYLVQGSELSYRENSLKSTDGDYSHRGEVTAVERRESGAAENAFVVNPPLPGDPTRWVGKTIRVTGGDGWAWAFRIDRVEGERVITDDEPGFELDSDGMDRQYFPLPEYLGLERIEGPVEFLVAGSALWENGDVRATRDPGPPLPNTESDAGVIADADTDVGNQDTFDINDGPPEADGGPTDVAANPADGANAGCGCAMASNEPANWILLLLIMMLVVVRRQQKNA